MRVAKALLVTGLVVLASGCYHQVVNTGRTPGSMTVSKPWTATWIFGLVPAKAIDVTQQCPAGIATVSTQQSVPNSLATIVTLGLYTPREVTVQCAQGTSGSAADAKEIVAGPSRAERESALLKAAILSQQTGSSVRVRF